jgi:hypothetical protein
VVKTADDRLAVVWPEMVSTDDCSAEQLEDVIARSMNRHGYPFEMVFNNLVEQIPSKTNNHIFSY